MKYICLIVLLFLPTLALSKKFIETPIVKFCLTFIVVTLNHVLAKVMPFRNQQITTINYPFG